MVAGLCVFSSFLNYLTLLVSQISRGWWSWSPDEGCGKNQAPTLENKPWHCSFCCTVQDDSLECIEYTFHWCPEVSSVLSLFLWDWGLPLLPDWPWTFRLKPSSYLCLLRSCDKRYASPHPTLRSRDAKSMSKLTKTEKAKSSLDSALGFLF